MVQRTPRNYNGIVSPSKKIKDLLPSVLNKLSRDGQDIQDAVFLEWKILLGEKMAHLTEPVSLVDGIFTVKVKSAILYSLLCQHERPRLLKELKKKFPIHKLILRMG